MVGLCCLGAGSWSTEAQTDTEAPLSETNLTVRAFEIAYSNLLSATEVNADVRSALTNAYHLGAQRARERDGLLAAKAEHEKAIASATNQVVGLRQEIAALAAPATNETANLDAAELRSRLAQTEATEDITRKALARFEEEAKIRKVRMVEIPKLIAAAQAKLDEIKLGLDAKPAEGEAVAVTRANRLLLNARKALREQEVATLEAELKAYNATADVLALQTERESKRLGALTKQIGSLRERVGKAAAAEAELAAERARNEKNRLNDAFWQSFTKLNELATTNAALADQLKSVSESFHKAATDLAAREKDLLKLTEDFKTAKGRVAAFEDAKVRINQKVGELLRDHRRNLLGAVSRTVIRKRLGEITDASLRALEYEEARDEYNAANEVERLMGSFRVAGLLKTLETNRVEKVAARTVELAHTRSNLLYRLVQENHSLGAELTKLNAADLEFSRRTDEFQAYIDERVLWVRSSPLLSTEAALEEAGVLAGLFVPANWLGLWPVMGNGMLAEPLATLFWLAVVVAVFLGQPRARRNLDLACATARNRENVSLWPTWSAVLFTAIVAAPLPVIFWAVGNILLTSTISTNFSEALANALYFTATIYFTLGFLRHLTRRPGLAADHFDWNEADSTLIRRHLNWFLTAAVALAFVISFIEGDRTDLTQARISFVVLMGFMTVFAFLLLHPARGLSPTIVGRGNETWQRFRFGICLLLPVLLGIASIVGYHYTAIELAWRLVDTVWLVLGIVLASTILLRWFYLERKRIALSKLDLRKAAAGDTVILREADQAVANISVTEIKEQTQSLLRITVLVSLIAGLWAIWSDVTPALNILDRKALWHVEVTPEPVATAESAVAGSTAALTGGAVTSPTPAVDESKKKVLRPITVADVLFAFAVFIVMGIIARNLPSFLELLILKHLKLETGGAYAITTIIQYVVIVVGLLIACSTIGLTWEKVQWLAAAVTLGIGFGLQEIFANFVAGIILLFERPVRVGDVITVGNTTGVVSRIRIRATTITNWERQELVLPNKDLITGSLTNWTLSDTTNRVVITVGVAYGSDIRKVRDVLMDIVANNPYVMKDPQPRVVFDMFGESALNFTIRAFISKMDDRLFAIHSLHETINNRFREEGIEISFPQRDLHIRSGLENLNQHKP